MIIIVCPKCGKEIYTNICYNCGYEVQPTQNISVEQSVQYPYAQDDGFLSESRLANRNGRSATVKAMDWFKLTICGVLIGLIPFVGGLGSLIYYLIMFFRKNTAESIRGYLKYQLIVSAVVCVLSIILLIVVFSIASAALPAATNVNPFARTVV